MFEQAHEFRRRQFEGAFQGVFRRRPGDDVAQPLAPLAEEFGFRGYLYLGLRQNWGETVAAFAGAARGNSSQVPVLQLTGTAACVASADRRAWHLSQLAARYPFLKRLANAPPALQAAYARAAVYRFEPTRAVLIDNTKGFGHKETLDLSTGV